MQIIFVGILNRGPNRMINNTQTEFLQATTLLKEDYTDVEIEDGMSKVGRDFKRVADVVVAAICLVIFSPLFLICYIAVKLEDGGPAIFKQERIGLRGLPFTIYKFRSMKKDAEKDGPQLAGHENSHRMTKVGLFLRNHHLDELPQLWNVLIGDMTFIGPRPERKYYIDQIIKHDPRYTELYQIRPGVTSYATLYNGYTDTMEKMLKRLELDLYYLENRSWWFDTKILIKTFLSIICGKKF
jgi:lipopolysaccharide/colanic/teichoic acid biosynthesis glycosyltransferase